MNGGGKPGSSIVEWNPFTGQGLITGATGVHRFSARDSSARLLAALSAVAIPPGSVAVTFDLAPDNVAINVDLAAGIDVAASDFD
jgi:hypothetical protein